MSTPMQCLLITILVFVCMPARALATETDQFYTWNRPFNDGTEIFNRLVNQKIQGTIERLNDAGGTSRFKCEKVAEKIKKELASMALALDFWPGKLRVIPRMPHTKSEEKHYQHVSYHRPYRRYWYTTMLIGPTPSIDLAGVAVGIDKIQHFFSTGWRGYKKWHKAIDRGDSVERAFEKALDYSIWTENTYLGYWPSGVFSFGDIEADYQGTRFYATLCHGENPALIPGADKRWAYNATFDWNDYITPDFDESYNYSVYKKSRWKAVKPRLQELCPLLSDPAFPVFSRRAAYAARGQERSFAMKYLEAKVESGKVADQNKFSLETICHN